MKALVLALIACSSLAQAGVTLDKLEASVNSTIILNSDVQKFRDVAQLRAQLDPLFAGTTVAQKGAQSSREEIIQFLIDERLILQAFAVTDQEVDQEINSILANNKIDRSVLKETLKNQGFLFEDYYDLIRVSASKRNLIDRDIRTKVTITDDDIKNHFYSHFAKNTQVPKTFFIRVLAVDPRNYKTPEAARETANRAAREIRGGEPFAEIAKRTVDPSVEKDAGEIQTFSEDQMSPAIKNALKDLQVGQVSDAIGTPDTAYLIVKLEDIKSGEDARYERMKDEIRNGLAATEYQHQIAIWIDRQRSQSYIHLSGEDSIAGIPK